MKESPRFGWNDKDEIEARNQSAEESFDYAAAYQKTEGTGFRKLKEWWQLTKQAFGDQEPQFDSSRRDFFD